MRKLRFSLLVLGLLVFPACESVDEAVVEEYKEPISEPEPEPAVDFDTARAYEGKGAKVLPILAKLQSKYESMEEDDKAKLLEKADTYRAKFKTAIDKIDEETATKYGLNRNLINKILGLDAVQEKDSYEEISPQPEPEPAPYNQDPEPYGPDQRIAAPIESYDKEPENYDHLITDHSYEPVVPQTFNVDYLKDQHVYIPGEDEHYKQFRDSMHAMKGLLENDFKPIYADNGDDEDDDYPPSIPFPAYAPYPRVPTNLPYEADYHNPQHPPVVPSAPRLPRPEYLMLARQYLAAQYLTRRPVVLAHRITTPVLHPRPPVILPTVPVPGRHTMLPVVRRPILRRVPIVY